jgi:GFO/IDH/MocA oxidoreductase family protein
MTRRLTMALVGCGAISRVHLAAIREGAPEIAITAAIDADRERAAAMARETGARAFASLEEGLAHGNFAAVDLMLPHDYRLAELPMTPATRAHLDAFMADNPRGKYGRVLYDLRGDFGIEPAALRRRFAFYLERFPVRVEHD